MTDVKELRDLIERLNSICGGFLSPLNPDDTATVRQAADALQSLTANHGEAEEIIAEHKAEIAKLAEDDPEFEALMRQRYPVPPYSEKASKASAAKYREAAMLALRENITLAAKVQSLTARVAGMEEALRPFAVEGRAWKHEFETRGDSRIRIGRNDVNEHFATGISLSDFVRADRALNPVEGE